MKRNEKYEERNEEEVGGYVRKGRRGGGKCTIRKN